MTATVTNKCEACSTSMPVHGRVNILWSGDANKSYRAEICLDCHISYTAARMKGKDVTRQWFKAHSIAADHI